MKIANISNEILHIFRTTWGISMKFSRKMWLMLILKVAKNQGFTLTLEDKFFEKPQGANWLPSRFRVKQLLFQLSVKYFHKNCVSVLIFCCCSLNVNIVFFKQLYHITFKLRPIITLKYLWLFHHAFHILPPTEIPPHLLSWSLEL